MSEWVNKADIEYKLGNKLLLAGLSEAGKTAVKKLYFQNSKVDEIKGLNATLNYERLNITINNVPITILDLGGQRVFIKRFLSGFSPFVFSSVRGLIFLIDTSIKATRNNSIQYFGECLKKLEQFSPKSEVFVFLHKIDLIKSQPNYDTILQLLMEQFQIESKKKIRFFFTSIYEPDTVFNSFLRIFEVIIPENLNEKIVGQIEQYASIKYTSKNVDVLNLPGNEDENLQQEEVLAHSNFEPMANVGANEQKFTGDVNELMDIQSLMKQAYANTSSEAQSDFPEQNKFRLLADLQKSIKEGMAEQIQVYHNRGLSYISEVFQEETLDDVSLESPEKTHMKEQVSKQILDTLQRQVKIKTPQDQKASELISESVEETKPPTTFDEMVKQFSSFYGIDQESAENIIRADFVDLFNELVMRSNIPMETVMHVLLVNIPFLKVLGNDISVLNDRVILHIFKFFMIGTISENQIYQTLEYFVKHPDMLIDDIVNIVKNIGDED